ncbi:MAG: hypothetical protein QW756_05530 [Nitrososphaerota archaeon]
MIRDGRHTVRDHDYIETVDGWIFCVVSDLHPPGRVLAYLKYIPGDGPWVRDNTRFIRMVGSYSMEEVGRTIGFIRERKPQYVYLEPTIGEEFTYPPLSSMANHYRPEERLREVLDSPQWIREKDCRRIVLDLSQGSQSLLGFMGVTGSLLPGLKYGKADVDLIVYGRNNYLRILDVSDQIQGRGERELLETMWLRSFLARYRLERGEALQLFQRVRNKGFYQNVPYSIHAVRTVEELSQNYGDMIFRPAGVGRVVLKVLDSSESYFTPSVYRVESVASGLDVETLTCYDSTFSGLFQQGDTVEAVGKLETVYDKLGGRMYTNLLVGSIRTGGVEYVKLLDSA